MKPQFETASLRLMALSRSDVLAYLETMPAMERVELSAAWLDQLAGSADCDPWIHGFGIRLKFTGEEVGRCGFTGPPGPDGVVEIAYGVAPERQGRGYATEAAAALTAYAWSHPEVRTVRAHTLPRPSASTRVLTKCGFQRIGEVVDPDDGPVWRWEILRAIAGV